MDHIQQLPRLFLVAHLRNCQTGNSEAGKKIRLEQLQIVARQPLKDGEEILCSENEPRPRGLYSLELAQWVVREEDLLNLALELGKGGLLWWQGHLVHLPGRNLYALRIGYGGCHGKKPNVCDSNGGQSSLTPCLCMIQWQYLLYDIVPEPPPHQLIKLPHKNKPIQNMLKLEVICTMGILQGTPYLFWGHAEQILSPPQSKILPSSILSSSLGTSHP